MGDWWGDRALLLLLFRSEVRIFEQKGESNGFRVGGQMAVPALAQLLSGFSRICKSGQVGGESGGHTNSVSLCAS